MKSSCKIRGLRLISEKITDTGVRHMCKAALGSHNCKLKKLELCSNQITDRSIPLLREAIQHKNCKLKTLVVDSKCISSTNMIEIQKLLKERREESDLAVN